MAIYPIFAEDVFHFFQRPINTTVYFRTAIDYQNFHAN